MNLGRSGTPGHPIAPPGGTRRPGSGEEGRLTPLGDGASSPNRGTKRDYANEGLMTDLHWWSCVLIFGVAALVTLVCIPVALRVAKRLDCFDVPAAGKSTGARPLPRWLGHCHLVRLGRRRGRTRRDIGPPRRAQSGSVPRHGRWPGRVGSCRRPPGTEPPGLGSLWRLAPELECGR